jgi:hypothetical protein
MQATKLLPRIDRRFPIPFLRHIMQYELRDIAKLGCKLTTLRLKHIADDDPISLRGEQASLGRALSACASHCPLIPLWLVLGLKFPARRVPRTAMILRAACLPVVSRNRLGRHREKFVAPRSLANDKFQVFREKMTFVN